MRYPSRLEVIGGFRRPSRAERCMIPRGEEDVTGLSPLKALQQHSCHLANSGRSGYESTLDADLADAHDAYRASLRSAGQTWKTANQAAPNQAAVLQTHVI